MGKIHLSGVVVCQDNETTIEPVLDCLAPLCDEIVVVDGGSADGTREAACTREKVRLYERPFDNHRAQKNFGFDQALGDWILVLDSDELLGGRGLGRIDLLTRIPGMHWYSLPRYWLVDDGVQRKYLAGGPYYRDRQLRLFRNEPGFRYDESRHPIHHVFQRKRGGGRPLRQPHIYHYAFLLQDRAEREKKVERYMEIDPQSERLHRMHLWEESGVPLGDLPDPEPRPLG